jgi:hypothetical protein
LAEEILVTKLFGSINSGQEIRWVDLRQGQCPGRVDAAIPVIVEEELAGTKIHHQKRFPFYKPVADHVERGHGVNLGGAASIPETHPKVPHRVLQTDGASDAIGG